MRLGKTELPILDTVSQEEMHAALVRAVLARNVPDPDAYLEANVVDARVAHRFMRAADGGQMVIASVVILSTSPRAQAQRQPTDTPVPVEPKK